MPSAEQSLTNALAVDAPECKALQDAWQARAEVRMRLGKLPEARADFEKCRDISVETLTGKSLCRSAGEDPMTRMLPTENRTSARPARRATPSLPEANVTAEPVSASPWAGTCGASASAAA